VQRSIIILLSGLCILLLVTCRKKDSSSSASSLGSYSFTASELAILPYPTFDTLIFKSTEGDSIIFKYSGRNSVMKTYYEKPDNPSGYQGNYYNCEVNSTGFVSPNSDYIIFNLHYLDPFLGNTGVKYFDMGLVTSNNASCILSAEFRFEADTLISYMPDAQFKTGGYVKGLYTSLVIGPRLFENVYELTGPILTAYCPVYISMVYYSISQGIIGFSQNTGKTWFLLPAKISPPADAVTPRPYLPVYPASYWIYNTGSSTSTSRTSNNYVNFSGMTLTTLDAQPVNQYERFVTYGTYQLGWVPVLSETVGAKWEVPLGIPSSNPSTQVYQVMKKTLDSKQDSIIIQKYYTYHKDPLNTNSILMWQTFKKNVGLVFECWVDTATNDTIFRKTLIDYHINH